MSAVTDRPLEERVRELAALERLLEAARAGVGGGLLLEGPPGIGKSRLLAAARAAAGPGVRVVSARASELERDFPFAVVRQLLEPVLVAGNDDERRGLLDGAGALAELVLATTENADGSVPHAAASALHGLYWFTANLASRAPLLMVVDDLHWADLPSLRWLAYLALRLDGMPLAVLGAARPGDGAVGQTELDALAANPSVEVLQPGGLSHAAVGRLAERRLGAAADPEFVAVCSRVTGGNPFLLHELIGELASGDVAPSAKNAGLVARQTPRSVSRAASARLRQLPPQARALAQAVVVLGDGAELTLAARLADLDPDDASDAADALADASILAPGRPLSFVHPLVRASIYAELGAGVRDRSQEEWGIRTPAMSHWRSGAAHVLAELGRLDEARRLALESVERCRWFGSPCQLGTALRVAGRCADREPGLELLAESVAVLADSPARLEHARAAFELGAALRRTGRRADARASLRDAMGLARACGAEPLAARAHDELVAAGAKPRRDPIESRSRLTASELRVARLAADGLTNREIAQSLFLTEKTIEVHLTNSYRKLGIGSRTQLRRALPATPAA